MLSTLVIKELKAILLSPKFAATFAVASVLILLSVFIGIREYRAAVQGIRGGTTVNRSEPPDTGVMDGAFDGGVPYTRSDAGLCDRGDE